MTRMRSWGPPTRRIVGFMVAGVVLLVLGTLVIHGTPSRLEPLVPGHPGRGRVLVDQTGARDYLRLALEVLGVGLVLAGVLRWSTRREAPPQESDAQRRYGDSIVDIRTSADPEIGIRATELPRHHWPL